MKKIKSAPQKKGLSFDSWVKTLNLPQGKEIDRLNLYKLNELTNSLADQIEEFQFSSIREVPDLKKYPLLHKVFRRRFERILQESLRSTLWKKTLRQLKRQKILVAGLDSGDLPIECDFPEPLVQKAYFAVLKHYETSLFGPWSLIELKKSGTIANISLSDTEDRDLFFSFIFKQNRRSRSGGSPPLSATLFAENVCLRGTDRKWYQVTKVGKTRRWQPAKTF